MTRRALLVASIVFLAAACGSGGHAIDLPRMTAVGLLKHPVLGSVRIYFCNTLSMPDCRHDAQPGDERAVRAFLAKQSCVGQVVFISKAEALRWMKATNPALPAPPLPANPLPDADVVIPRNTSCTDAITKAVQNAGLAGVEKVAPATGRPQ